MIPRATSSPSLGLGVLGLALLSACGGSESGSAGSSGGSPAGLSVAAALSLQDLLESAAPLFEAERPGARLDFEFATSSALALEIEGGAPFDLFLSSDYQTIDPLRHAGKASAIVPFLANRLALVAREDLEEPAIGLEELKSAEGTIALPDQNAPVGRYARAYLERKSLLSSLEARFVPASEQLEALDLVESGEADYALVYETDARRAQHAKTVWTAPAFEKPKITYVAVALKGRESPLAEEFLGWLRSPAFLEKARELGFSTP